MSPVKIDALLTRVIYNNFGGPNTNRGRLAQAKPERLWRIVLERRAQDNFLGQQNPVITATLDHLHRAGLEDPLEITPEIADHVRTLFERYDPQTELEKTVLLFRSIIPASQHFSVGGTSYQGLTPPEGGLSIHFSEEMQAPLRAKFGSILPKELLKASPEERGALCLEFSHLMVVFLRAAKIKASAMGDAEHSYVITFLNEVTYKVDIAQLIFEPASDRQVNAEARSLAQHYGNKGALTGNDMNKLEYFQRALEIFPLESAVWTNLGQYYLSDFDLGEAMECSQKALELNPKDHKAWTIQGTILRMRGDLDGALQCLEAAVKITEGDASVWNEMGVLYMEKGDPVKAVELFDEAIWVDRDCASAWGNRGTALIEQNMPDEAMASFERSDSIRPFVFPDWKQIGSLFHGKKMFDQALVCYRRAVQRKPLDDNGWANLGILLRRENALDEAQAALEKAIEINPRHHGYWNALGDILFYQEKAAEALRCFQEAIKIDPNCSSTKEKIARARLMIAAGPRP